MAKDILTETFVALRDRLHLVACRLLGNEPEAEDAVQDTFCNIWSHSLPDTSPQARYLLFAVLKNVCLNKLKKRRLLVDIVNADVPVDERGFDESQRLRDCLLDSLPPVQRKVFELAVIEELEYEEIARELNMSDEAVRVNMSRARKKLREQYKKIREMNDKDNLTLAELEMLAQAYLDCKLSRLQEKELEYVLMSCGLSSPLIDEVRECMALSTLIASGKPAKKKRNIIRWVAAACVGAIAIFAVTGLLDRQEPADNYLCVIVDGNIVPEAKAMEIALETRNKSLEMFYDIVEEAEIERNTSIRTMNHLLEEK